MTRRHSHTAPASTSRNSSQPLPRSLRGHACHRCHQLPHGRLLPQSPLGTQHPQRQDPVRPNRWYPDPRKATLVAPGPLHGHAGSNGSRSHPTAVEPLGTCASPTLLGRHPQQRAPCAAPPVSRSVPQCPAVSPCPPAGALRGGQHGIRQGHLGTLGDVAVVEGAGSKQDIVVHAAQQERAEGNDEQELPGGTGGTGGSAGPLCHSRGAPGGDNTHRLHQLQDIREQDAGKAVPLVELVDVGGLRRLRGDDGPPMSTLIPRVTPCPPVSPTAPPGPVPGYLGEETVQVLDVVPRVWGEKHGGVRWERGTAAPPRDPCAPGPRNTTWGPQTAHGSPDPPADGTPVPVGPSVTCSSSCSSSSSPGGESSSQSSSRRYSR